MNQRTNTRKAKANETKKKIYLSADKLFKKHGFENVSVDSIVEMAGVSKGSFYVHFDSKSTLIAALIGDFLEKVELDYKRFITSFPSDTTKSDLIIALAGKIADVIAVNIGYDLIKLIYEAQITRTVEKNPLLAYNREIYPMFKDILLQGIQQGEFKKELDVDVVTNHCIMSIRGLTYEWCIRYPDFDLRDQVEKHFDILLNGMKNTNC
ncbi:MAG: TetR/AcrR family transcriptional regulator [Bacillota bacterium]|nr:TetR/AcrR family transcriptional regulator [Bacillota bacterium]